VKVSQKSHPRWATAPTAPSALPNRMMKNVTFQNSATRSCKKARASSLSSLTSRAAAAIDRDHRPSRRAHHDNFRKEKRSAKGAPPPVRCPKPASSRGRLPLAELVDGVAE